MSLQLQTPESASTESCRSQCGLAGCGLVESVSVALQRRETALEMNNLQVQLAQCQEALRQSNLEKQQGRDSLVELKTHLRQVQFSLNQAQLARRDLTTKLQIVISRKADMRTLIDIQEASKINSERQVAEAWLTIERLTEIVHGLRDHLDGHKLSQDERAIDVGKLLLEKERFQSRVRDLRYELADYQMTTEASISRLTAELTTYRSVIRSKDERIAELERACARTDQDMRGASRLTQRNVAGV